MRDALITAAQPRTRNVPAAALRQPAAGLQLGDNGQAAQSAPVRIVARTGDAIDHWYWGRLVHDLAGLQIHKARIPIDYCHDPEEVLGYLNRFSTETGDLIVSGAVTPEGPGDRAAEIIAKARAGVPYEASIDWSGPAAIEEIDAGQTAEANGRLFNGPVTIVRQWYLRGVAICPYGADMNTETQLSRGKTATLTVLPHTEPAPMSKKPAKATTLTADDQAAATPADDQPAASTPADGAPDQPEPAPIDATPTGDDAAEAADGHPEADAPAAPAAPPATESAAPGQAFLDAFGDRGAVWFAQGKTLDEARDLYCAELAEENARLRARLAAVGAELSSDEPAEFQADEPDAAIAPPARLAENVGPNVARLAAGIKMPGSNSHSHLKTPA